MRRRRVPGDDRCTDRAGRSADDGWMYVRLGVARIAPESLDMVILNAGVKYDGESVLSLVSFRDTFQVNLFSAAELARWLCRPEMRTARAIIDRVSKPHVEANSADATIDASRDSQLLATIALVLVS